MFTLSHFKLLCKTIHFLELAFIWLIIGRFIYDSYYYFMAQSQLWHNLLNLDYVSKNSKFIISFFLQFFISFGWCLVKILVIACAYKLFLKCPMSTRTIGRWFDEGQINPVLGRDIVYHYRAQKYLNIRRFMHLVGWSEVENYHIWLHEKNPHLTKLFDTYDCNYRSDLSYFSENQASQKK